MKTKIIGAKIATLLALGLVTLSAAFFLSAQTGMKPRKPRRSRLR